MTEKPKTPKPKPTPTGVKCGHCGKADFATKTFRVAPGEFDLRNPTEWLGTVMTAYVCAACGHVEFFADQAR